jgi:hypothetical protein
VSHSVSARYKHNGPVVSAVVQRTRTYLEKAGLDTAAKLEELHEAVRSNYTRLSMSFDFFASKSLNPSIPLAMDKTAYNEWMVAMSIFDNVGGTRGSCARRGSVVRRSTDAADCDQARRRADLRVGQLGGERCVVSGGLHQPRPRAAAV